MQKTDLEHAVVLVARLARLPVGVVVGGPVRPFILPLHSVVTESYPGRDIIPSSQRVGHQPLVLLC